VSVKPSAVFDDIPESMPSGSDDKSELSKVTEILLNEQWGRRKTNIRQQLISAITTLDTIRGIFMILVFCRNGSLVIVSILLVLRVRVVRILLILLSTGWIRKLSVLVV